MKYGIYASKLTVKTIFIKCEKPVFLQSWNFIGNISIVNPKFNQYWYFIVSIFAECNVESQYMFETIIGFQLRIQNGEHVILVLITQGISKCFQFENGPKTRKKNE